jgi:hypothetical protein
MTFDDQIRGNLDVLAQHPFDGIAARFELRAHVFDGDGGDGVFGRLHRCACRCCLGRFKFEPAHACGFQCQPGVGLDPLGTVPGRQLMRHRRVHVEAREQRAGIDLGVCG